MKLIFPKVWFATEKLMNNQARFFNFSDRGSLRFEAGTVKFSGRKHSLRINKIRNIDLIYPRIPWISHAYSVVALIVVLIFILSRMPSELVFTIVFTSVSFIVIISPFVIFVQKAMLWIEITFMDEENVLHHAYFLDSSRLGLNMVGSMLDDTLKMYKELRSIETTKAG
jgi:hypothetical protein